MSKIALLSLTNSLYYGRKSVIFMIITSFPPSKDVQDTFDKTFKTEHLNIRG
jgi:hypothetical protein